MKHVLYIGEGCHDCHLVMEFIEENKLDVEIIDADKERDRVSFDIFVRPALMRDETLVGYGLDVMDYLKRKVMV